MKRKIFIIAVAIILAGVLLYFFKISNSENNLKSKMESASRDYFQKYISTNDSKSIYQITLGMLESSNENYDLKGLEKCDKEKTFSNITVNYSTGEAKKVEVELKC